MQMAPQPDGLDLALAREATGERILWQARRIARIDRRAFGIYVFAIPWTAFALFWTAMAAGGVAQGGFGRANVLAWAFPLFGLPFIAIGAAMLAKPFFGLWAGNRTLYAATNKRLLKLTMGRALNVESVAAERVGPMIRTERPDGSGSLSFAIRIGIDSDGDRTVERFEIDDVADVFDASRRIEGMRSSVSSLVSSPSAAPGR